MKAPFHLIQATLLIFRIVSRLTFTFHDSIIALLQDLVKLIDIFDPIFLLYLHILIILNQI